MMLITRNSETQPKKLASEGIKVRYVPLTIELYELILFSVNVFVRLSDIKNLKHKHIRVVRDKKTEYLSITPTRIKNSDPRKCLDEDCCHSL